MAPIVEVISVPNGVNSYFLDESSNNSVIGKKEEMSLKKEQKKDIKHKFFRRNFDSGNN